MEISVVNLPAELIQSFSTIEYTLSVRYRSIGVRKRGGRVESPNRAGFACLLCFSAAPLSRPCFSLSSTSAWRTRTCRPSRRVVGWRLSGVAAVAVGLSR